MKNAVFHFIAIIFILWYVLTVVLSYCSFSGPSFSFSSDQREGFMVREAALVIRLSDYVKNNVRQERKKIIIFTTQKPWACWKVTSSTYNKMNKLLSWGISFPVVRSMLENCLLSSFPLLLYPLQLYPMQARRDLNSHWRKQRTGPKPGSHFQRAHLFQQNKLETQMLQPEILLEQTCPSLSAPLLVLPLKLWSLGKRIPDQPLWGHRLSLSSQGVKARKIGGGTRSPLANASKETLARTQCIPEREPEESGRRGGMDTCWYLGLIQGRVPGRWDIQDVTDCKRGCKRGLLVFNIYIMIHFAMIKWRSIAILR